MERGLLLRFFLLSFYFRSHHQVLELWSLSTIHKFLLTSSISFYPFSFFLSLSPSSYPIWNFYYIHRLSPQPSNHTTNVIHETKSCLKNIFSLSPSSSSSFLYRPVWHIQSPTLLRLAGEISCSWVELCISLITTLPYHLENSLPPLVKKNFIIEWINDDICRCAKDSEHLIIIKDDQREGKGKKKKKKKKKKKNLPLDVIHDDDGPPPLKILSCKYYVTAFVVQFITTNPNLNPNPGQTPSFFFSFSFPPSITGLVYLCPFPSFSFLSLFFFFFSNWQASSYTELIPDNRVWKRGGSVDEVSFLLSSNVLVFWYFFSFFSLSFLFMTILVQSLNE